MAAELKHAEITEQVIGAFYAVYATLGYGFLEKVYANALAVELGKRGLKVEQEVSIPVFYAGEVVGIYFADLVVEGRVIVEVKAGKAITEQHEAQLLNYLKATFFEVGLLVNFGPKPEFKRKAFDNARKGGLSWAKAAGFDPR